MINGMQSFKSISDYPSVPCTILSPENLAKYDDYMKEAIEQSRRMAIAAREWASKNIIRFHNGR